MHRCVVGALGVGVFTCWRVGGAFGALACLHVRVFACRRVGASARWHQHSGLWHNWRDVITYMYDKFLGALNGTYVLYWMLCSGGAIQF